MLNLLELEPNKVSVDLTQYSMVVIGDSGVGKTHTLKLFLEELSPDGKLPLFLMFEDRYQNIPGIMAQRIRNVTDLKSTISQLKNPKLKEKYSCIVVDTVDKFEELAEQYVTDNANAAILKDVGAFGEGTQRFKKVVRMIGDLRNLGFTVHFIAQSQHIKDMDTKQEIDDIKLNKNTLSYIREGAFVMGYMWKETVKGVDNRYITFTANSKYPKLKDTFNLPEKIKFNELKNVWTNTITELGKNNVTDSKTIVQPETKTSFEDIKIKGQELGGVLAENGYLEDAMDVLKRNIGTDDNGNVRMFDSLKDTQLDLANVIVMELEELIDKYKLKK